MVANNTSSSVNIDLYVVPNSGGSAGSASSTTQIARLGIGTDDTFFFEPAYPVVIRNNGDTLQIQNEATAITNAINVLVTGDIDL